MKKIFNNIWFRCISVLLLLAVVLGGTLAILNDVLYVSPEERTSRAVKKIYGELVDYKIESEEIITYENLGSINKIYSVGESDMLFQTTGINGYKGGNITLWIKVVTNQNGNKIIDKVVLESYDKQTLMSKFDGEYYEGFYQDVKTVEDNEFFNPKSGATKSANAMNNAVKCVSEYFKGVND